MFWNRGNTAQAEHEGERAEGASPLASLPEVVRFDRYGRAIAENVPVLIHRLPAPDEAVEAITSTAQRALGALPVSLPDVQLPGRKRKRRGPNRLILLLIVLGAAAGGYLFVRRMMGGGDEDEWAQGVLDSEWPARPATGDTQQPPEPDAQAQVDAEQSAKLHTAEAQP